MCDVSCVILLLLSGTCQSPASSLLVQKKDGTLLWVSYFLHLRAHSLHKVVDRFELEPLKMVKRTIEIHPHFRPE